MASIFARQYARSFWNPDEWNGPCPDFTLREWEASVILCSLSPVMRRALLDWLSAPHHGRQQFASGHGFSQARAVCLQRTAHIG